MSADPRLPILRRDILKGLTAAPFLAAAPAFAGASPQKIVSLDYGLASTLLSIGVTPSGVASLADWDTWVVEPEMPASVVDLGSAWEVNFEVLLDLKPDLILTTPYLEALKPRLETIAPVLSVPVYNADGKPVLSNAWKATRALGERIGRPRAAEDFLEKAGLYLETCRNRIARLDAPPIVLANFLDARHARIYCRPGLYQGVLDRLGVRNLCQVEGNYWGFQTIGIEELAAFTDPRAKLIAFEPMPRNAMRDIERSPLWQALPFARPGHFSVLPGVLMFGMVREALRFARLITEHLEASR